MFHERSLFFPEYASSEYVRMPWYMSMLKKDIIKFVMNSHYCTLGKLQSNTRRKEIELETQVRQGEVENQRREKRHVLV